MSSADASLVPPVIIVAALVIRTAIGELRRPGSARRQWAFATDGRAMTGGGVVAAAMTAIGWSSVGWAAVAWAVLAGSLTAYVIGRGSRRD